MLTVMQLTLTWVTTLDNRLQQDGELLASSVSKVVDPITGSINITGLYVISKPKPFTFLLVYRVPASNKCSGVSKEDKKTTRTPALNFPEYIPQRYPPKGDKDDEDRSLVSMRAEPDTPEGCCDDLPDGHKCQKSCLYLIKNGETALGADMGFYFNFTVDPETGKPGGCDGLTFNQHNKSPTVNCGLNHYAPEGEPLYHIVEDYADHQDIWFRDFLTAFDKMSRNGNTGLEAGPTSWFNAPCTLQKKYWICEPEQ